MQLNPFGGMLGGMFGNMLGGMAAGAAAPGQVYSYSSSTVMRSGPDGVYHSSTTSRQAPGGVSAFRLPRLTAHQLPACGVCGRCEGTHCVQPSPSISALRWTLSACIVQL